MPRAYYIHSLIFFYCNTFTFNIWFRKEKVYNTKIVYLFWIRKIAKLIPLKTYVTFTGSWLVYFRSVIHDYVILVLTRQMWYLLTLLTVMRIWDDFSYCEFHDKNALCRQIIFLFYYFYYITQSSDIWTWS